MNAISTYLVNERKCVYANSGYGLNSFFFLSKYYSISQK